MLYKYYFENNSKFNNYFINLFNLCRSAIIHDADNLSMIYFHILYFKSFLLQSYFNMNY